MREIANNTNATMCGVRIRLECDVGFSSVQGDHCPIPLNNKIAYSSKPNNLFHGDENSDKTIKC